MSQAIRHPIGLSAKFKIDFGLAIMKRVHSLKKLAFCAV
jgi:hypothetical protein